MDKLLEYCAHTADSGKKTVLICQNAVSTSHDILH